MNNTINHALMAKKKIFTLLLTLIASVGTLFAEGVKIDDLYYIFYTDGESVGVAASVIGKYAGEVTIPESVNYNSATYKVVSICEDAFSKCYALTKVTIPNSVRSIENSAFSGCSGLTSVEIPNSVTSIGNSAFSGCSGLTSVEIPNSVTSIGNSAFSGCSGLNSIEIPNSIKSINNYTFNNCTGLTSLEIPNSVTSIGTNAFCYVANIVYSGDATGSPWMARSVNGYIDGYLVYSDDTKTTLLACPSSAIGDIIIPNSVTTISNSAFYGCSGLTSIEIPNSVTSIGNNAFYNCSGLTSIEIPNSVTTIGNSAFSGCTGIMSIEIPNSVTNIGNAAFYNVANIVYTGEATGSPWGARNSNGYIEEYFVYSDETKTKLISCPSSTIGDIIIPSSVTSIGNNAFSKCSGLTSIEIPNSVTTISNSAFYGCSGLTSIEIPNSVTSIGNNAFSGCTALKSVEISNSITIIQEKAFYGCIGLERIEIPNSVTIIAQSAFSNCFGLTSVEIPNSVYFISNNAFENCHNLTDIKIPNSVTTIKDMAFYGCTGLTSIEIPNSVKSIGNSAFSGCSSLTSVTIGNSVTAINPNTFNECYNLQSVILGNSVTTIEIQAFRVCHNLSYIEIPNSVTTIGIGAFMYCSGLTNVTIPNSVTTIKSDAFIGCSGLTNITIPNSVTTIEGRAFSNCSGLISVTIPNSITNIKSGIFYSCKGLTSVTIPNSVTSIEDQAFCYDNNITRIICKAITPPTCGGPYVFHNVNKSIPLYVPAESIEAYKAADGWKDFTNIQAINEFVVTFKNWDGTELAQVTVTKGEAATPPTDPTRDHYTFTGWDKDFSNVTEDMTVTALYDINYYPITFLNWNGALLSQQSVAYNQAAGAPEVPTREGYIFKGWTADIEHVIGQTFAIALFEKEGIDITYKAEDGDVLFTEQADLHIPAAPGISGKTFSGWLTEVADNTNGIVLRATYTTDNPTTDDDVKVEPSSTTADVSFPYITGAVTYMLVILDMSDVIVCKIMFGADGRLLGIALAPGRNRSQQQAQTEGFRFTVEGLTESTTYKYEFVAHDESDAVIETLSGSFTTTPNIATGAPSVKDQTSSTGKLIQNGHLLIQRGEKVYSADGQELR